jgi:hypothetical protein
MGGWCGEFLGAGNPFMGRAGGSQAPGRDDEHRYRKEEGGAEENSSHHRGPARALTPATDILASLPGARSGPSRLNGTLPMGMAP